MNASKEEAFQARETLEKAALMLDKYETIGGMYVLNKKQRDDVKRYLLRVDGFLEAAERKLPSEKSYERERQRKRTKKAE